MSNKGGVREGAGRKKGIPNKKTAKVIKQIEQSGLTPLAYMLQVMRDETQEPPIRMDAAKSAAPYTHARLATVENRLSGKLEISEIKRLIINPSVNPDH